MPKINVLSSTVYNRISAGEVVERPSSVVKELVENALDAKASSITIEIVEGGTKLIKITDNGCGIDFDDLKKAFLPHATSKISVADDLNSISTLGFRGEALASIASVSKVELISKPESQEVGGKIIIEGGEFSEVTECAFNNGTSIAVKDLFFNTPARLKFLKSNTQEKSYITNIVERLILANPEISFKYIVDGKIIYNSNTKGLSEKIYCIYGKEILNNLIKVNYQNAKYKIDGYISLPTYCKPNKTYQTLIINGRYVNNSIVTVAISNAYENFVMKGKFPIFVLNLSLNFEDIDVNVHPSKMEVKFKNQQEIYGIFHSMVLQFLNDSNYPVEFVVPEKETIKFKNEENTEKLPEIRGGFSFSDLKSFNDEIKNINVYMPTKKEESENNNILSNRSMFSLGILPPKIDVKSQITKDNYSESNLLLNKNDNENNMFEKFEQKTVYVQDKLQTDINFKVIGSAFNTYIIVENENDLYLFDQHAGHERLLYDRFIKQFQENKIINQPLLLPYIFTVNEIENELLLNSQDVFENFGFEISQFGNLTYKIDSVPSLLLDIDLKAFIDDLLKNNVKISSSNEEIKNFFATKACKAAVKGGQNLSEEEIKTLLKNIISKKTTLLCPHGRPICIKLSQTEIEKMFKRIV